MLNAPMIRLRALQALQLAHPERVNSDLVLTMLQRDDEYTKESSVLLALIWLEDQGLCDTRVIDHEGQVILFSRISARGLSYLHTPNAKLDGIDHPSRIFQAA